MALLFNVYRGSIRQVAFWGVQKIRLELVKARNILKPVAL